MQTLSQQGRIKSFDAIIIGSGIAGLSYALELIKLQPNSNIAIFSKTDITESNSKYAQGGIAAANITAGALEKHCNDTLSAGDGLCLNGAVQEILSDGTEAIKFLKANGVSFDVDATGNAELTQEGGHSERRIYHVADHTGKAIIQALWQAVNNESSIEVFSQHCAVNLITQLPQHIPGQYNEVIGAYILDQATGLINTCLAKVVILATGGAGKVYRYTSNSEVATGDGIAMAYRAGARVGNMEFYQFHPTLLYHPKKNNFLLTEALRGEGAYLRLPGSNERFMHNYDSRKELATRDIIARAIFNELETSGAACVYLDIQHKSREYLQARFPEIFNTLLELNLDLSEDLIPVVPAAHYLCGGILTDVNGKTDLPRLYAIGETAFTGLHGANRLASNSLLESVVMARNAASLSSKYLNYEFPKTSIEYKWDSKCVTDHRRASQINAHWRGLRGEMTSYAGIIRTEAGLKDLLRLINARKSMIDEYYWQHTVTRDFVELRNIILVAELIVKSALMRQESRGGHYRADYPNKLTNPQATLLRANAEINFELEYL